MAELEAGEIVSLKEQLFIAIEHGDNAAQGAAQDSLGAAYIALGKYSEAIECYKQVASIAVALGATHAEARAYYNIGNANNSLGNNEEAIKYYEKYLVALNLPIGQIQELGSYFEKYPGIAIATSEFDLVIESLRNIGNINNRLGKYQEALKYYKGCLEFSVKIDKKEAQKALFCDIGVNTYELRSYRESLGYFKKYLEMCEMSGDKKGEVIAYKNLGNAHFCLEDDDEALRCHEKSLSVAIQIDDKYGQQCAYQNMGRTYAGIGRNEEAIESYNKYLATASDIGDKAEERRAYGNLGDAYSALGDYKSAIEFHNKSLSIARESEDRNAELTSYEKIGLAYSLSGELGQAVTCYEKLLDRTGKIVDKQQQQRVYSALGRLHGQLSQYQKGIECFKMCIQILEERGDRRAEGNVHCNLGNLYLMTGQYAEAINCYEKCLGVALERKDKSLESKAQCNLGNAYQALGNAAEAIKHHRKSADIAIESGEREAEARSYCILGHLSYQSGDYKKSIEYQEKYLEIVQMIGDKQGELLACRNLGSAYLALGKHQEAINFHKRSAEIAAELGDKHGEGRAYEYIGYAYASSKDYLKSIENHEKHLHIAEAIGDKSGAGNACNSIGGGLFSLYLIGKTCQHKEKCVHHDSALTLRKAEHFLRESLKWYDAVFEDLGKHDQYKISIADKFLSTYEMLLELYIESEQAEKAMLVSERKRGRALEDILASKYKVPKKEKSVYDFLGYTDIKSKVLSGESCILFFSDLLRLTKNNNELTVGTWILDSNNDHVSFYRNEFNEIKGLSQEGFSDEDILNSKDILLHLVDKSYVSMSVRGEATCENRSFTINDNSTAQSSLEAQSTCARSGKRNTVDEEFDGDYLELLFDALITPVKHMLTQDEIIIVPDGPLFKIPFSALRDRDEEKYWSETKRLRIVPSLTTLTILKDSPADLHSMRGALIIGDPDVEGKRMLKDTAISFSALPNARREAEEIAKVLGVNALVGEQATKQVVMERLREGVAVIHFAAHGCADSGEIVLSPPESLKGTQTIPSEDDYLLTINEVQEIGLRARLVVLSCCHSGRGEIKSEGVIGMSRAFLAAGALAVVASLWAVDDLGTRVFMQKFYAQLKQGKSASRSLQQTMKEMREMKQYEEPSFWAPFVLIGEDVTINL